MSLRCRVLGHHEDRLFTQPEPRFERIWSGLMGEPVWMEVFDHQCLRCGATMRHWRWTRDAAAKKIAVEDHSVEPPFAAQE